MARPRTTDRRDHLERRGASDAAALGPPALVVAGVGVARQDRAGLRRRGSHPRRDRRRARLQPGDGRQVAAPLRRRPSRRAGRRAPPGRGPHDRRRRGRSDRGRDPGDRTAGCDALVDAGSGRQAWDLATPPCARSGGRSGSSRGARTTSRCPPTPTWSRRSATSSALYMNPPVAAAVFAVDEKPQIQALNRTAPTLPMLPTTRPGPPMTTSATAPATCSPPWRSPPAR